MDATGSSKKSNKEQAAILLHCAGAEAIEVYDQMEIPIEDREKPATVFTKLQEYCNPRNNEVMERYRFWKMAYAGPFDSFMTDIKTQAEKCAFQERDNMIRDKIVFSVGKQMKEKLLQELELTLLKAIEICQAVEETEKQMSEMVDLTGAAAKVERVMKP